MLHDDPYSWQLPEDYTEEYGDDAESMIDFDAALRAGIETGRSAYDSE